MVKSVKKWFSMNTPWHKNSICTWIYTCRCDAAVLIIWWVDQNSLRFEMHSPSIGKDLERKILLPNSMPRATIRETRKTAWFEALACMNLFFLWFSLYELTELLQYKGSFIYLSQGYVRNTWWSIATKGMTWSNHFTYDSSFLDALPYVCRLSLSQIKRDYTITPTFEAIVFFWNWNKPDTLQAENSAANGKLA